MKSDVADIVNKAENTLRLSLAALGLETVEGRYVLILADQPDQLESGLFLPDLDQDSQDPEVALVVATPSPNTLGVEVGEFVLIEAYMGSKFEFDGREYVSVFAESILSRITGVPAIAV